jgi:hypothetical protein
VHELTADFFRARTKSGELKPLRLYRHQIDTIEIAKRSEPYVVTTRTGSGKSMTYMVPIMDHVLRNQPEKAQVRAIIVYPMNALINSQAGALKNWKDNNPDIPVTFATHTGTTEDEVQQQILDSPTTSCSTLVNRITGGLEFLVLDELQTYRGRQGADVAMLMRRLRERSRNRKLMVIETSATMATGGKLADRRRAAAEVASKIFGMTIGGDNVVDETLRRAIATEAPSDDGLSMRYRFPFRATPNSSRVRHWRPWSRILSSWTKKMADWFGGSQSSSPTVLSGWLPSRASIAGPARTSCESVSPQATNCATRMASRSSRFGCINSSPRAARFMPRWNRRTGTLRSKPSIMRRG